MTEKKPWKLRHFNVILSQYSAWNTLSCLSTVPGVDMMSCLAPSPDTLAATLAGPTGGGANPHTFGHTPSVAKWLWKPKMPQDCHFGGKNGLKHDNLAIFGASKIAQAAF
jgi:hypothetical protein